MHPPVPLACLTMIGPKREIPRGVWLKTTWSETLFPASPDLTTASSFSQTAGSRAPASSSLVIPQLPHPTTPRHGKYRKLLRDLLSVLPLCLLCQTSHVQRFLPFPVRSNKSQSYEPLLLENEREAVADLLQFLESTQVSSPKCRFDMLTVDLRSHEYQLLLGSTTDRVDNTLVFR